MLIAHGGACPTTTPNRKPAMTTTTASIAARLAYLGCKLISLTEETVTVDFLSQPQPRGFDPEFTVADIIFREFSLLRLVDARNVVFADF